ncbi:hypothetical protein ACFL2Q_12195 [Thermodesulfobacteriota bacterium]
MAAKKDILDNELMKEIIAIRIDTLWKMLAHKEAGFLPGVNDEGATGTYDNKGAIFIPGGLIYQDVDEKVIPREPSDKMMYEEFRAGIRSAMQYDNATLLYSGGLSAGVNLDSGFFSKAARNIFMFKKAAFRRRMRI